MQDINTKELDRQEANSVKRLNKETPIFIEKFSGSLGDIGGGCTILINKTIQSIKDPVALGVYCYICSLPQSWIINAEQIRRHFGIGRDKIAKILNHLVELGALSFKKVRDSSKRFCKHLYSSSLLLSEPFTENQAMARLNDIASKDHENPLEPHTRNQEHIKNINNTEYIVNISFPIIGKNTEDLCTNNSLNNNELINNQEDLSNTEEATIIEESITKPVDNFSEHNMSTCQVDSSSPLAGLTDSLGCEDIFQEDFEDRGMRGIQTLQQIFARKAAEIQMEEKYGPKALDTHKQNPLKVQSFEGTHQRIIESSVLKDNEQSYDCAKDVFDRHSEQSSSATELLSGPISEQDLISEEYLQKPGEKFWQCKENFQKVKAVTIEPPKLMSLDRLLALTL